MKTLLHIKRIRKGLYCDQISHRYIERVNDQRWEVQDEVTGEVYFNAKTIKACKQFVREYNTEVNGQS